MIDENAEALYYRPSAGDLRYRNATVNGESPNPFDEAMLLRGISDDGVARGSLKLVS